MIGLRERVGIPDNLTLQAALSLGWTHLTAVRVDFDPATAAGFALADNRMAEPSEWDKHALDQLLREVSTGNDPRLDEMLAHLTKQKGLVSGGDADTDKGADRDEAKPDAVTWQVVIDCEDASEQAVLLERLRAEGYSCQGKSV